VEETPEQDASRAVGPRASDVHGDQQHAEQAAARLGLLFGLGAYGLWGIIPIYFRFLMHLPVLEVLAHRILWSFVFLIALLILMRRFRDLPRVLCSRDVMLRLIASTVLIAINWYTYIYAVSVERVLEASLGYFITPLVNVLLGIVFLKERLRAVQLAGLLLAAGGVANLALRGSGVPWIALTLAGSFAFYGLLRKTAAVDATLGLFVETLLLAPVALGWLVVLQLRGASEALAAGPSSLLILAVAGLVTTVPLLLFAGAARRLRMATLGFLQYLAPSLQFVLAVAVFGEPFSRTQLTSFACIWLAVALYSYDSIRLYRLNRVRLSQTLVTTPE
jgi:chloramphenicol-sensitive protein RarD